MSSRPLGGCPLVSLSFRFEYEPTGIHRADDRRAVIDIILTGMRRSSSSSQGRTGCLMAVAVALALGLGAAGCGAFEPDDITAPDTGWLASWTKLDNPDVRVRTLVVTDGEEVIYHGEGIELRDRDYNFAFWNGGTQLYAYSSDVGSTLVTFTEDGSSYTIRDALDEGYCLDLDPRVELGDKDREHLPPSCS